ncbi:MAG: radical SAM protein [Nitrososphaerota archaeon]
MSKKYDIILTADRTLMSDYHNHEFIGFGTCAPSNVIPDWLYKFLFFPSIKTNNGLPIAAPYGLRKIEAQLLREGFNVAIVDPDHLGKYINDTKVLGIYVMDPFGLGPASSTFTFIFKKEPFLAQYFRILIEKPEIKKAKEQGLKIIIGGPGAWQFKYRPKFIKEHKIDCVIDGEAEKIIGKIVQAVLDNEKLPQYYEVSIKEVPSLDEIPEIVAPSINGLIEIGRGCCRSCKFCSVTLRPLRWYSYEKILREIKVNMKVNEGTCLHAEDVMLYGSKNTIPNDEKLIKLHEMVLKESKRIGWSHCSLATITLKPKLFSKISEIILQKQSWWGAEVGIETGSVELVKKIMPMKVHPFKAEEWPEIVRVGLGLMHDYKLIPACTLIIGIPGETEDDIIKTIELIDDLKGIRSLIVPLFFVPMGRLKNENWFKGTKIKYLHKELLIKCLKHDLYWIDSLINLYFAKGGRTKILRPFYKFFVKLIKYKVKRGELNREF